VGPALGCTGLCRQGPREVSVLVRRGASAVVGELRPTRADDPGIALTCGRVLLSAGECRCRSALVCTGFIPAGPRLIASLGVRRWPRSDPFEDFWPDPAQSSLRVGSRDRLPVVAGND
jgi:hypothetical protein